MLQCSENSFWRMLVSAIGIGAVTGAGMLNGVLGFILTGSAIVALWLALRSRHPLLKPCLVVFAGLSIWFVVVHRVERYARCPICYYTIESSTIEVFCIPVSSETYESWGLTLQLARDFGCPCEHAQMADGFPLRDWWGLLYCPDPVEGTWGGFRDMEESEELYREVIHPKIEQLKKDRPDLADEFCRRVVQQGDKDYFIEFDDEVLGGILKLHPDPPDQP